MAEDSNNAAGSSEQIENLTDITMTDFDDNEDLSRELNGEKNGSETGGDDDEEEDTVAWKDLPKATRCYRYEAVRNQIGQYIINRQSILDHLDLVNGNIEEVVANLQHAHARAYTGVPGTEGEINLPLAINGVRIPYQRSADQERRAVADIILVIVNARRTSENQIRFSRAQAALLLEVADRDLEAATITINAASAAIDSLKFITLVP
jgi:hypothetical protein